MPTLTITQGENKGTSSIVKEEVVMGRSPETQLVLKDLRASRKHARVMKINKDYYLEDMNSQNGTILNGRRIRAKERLKNNDHIRIGNTWICFVLEPEILKPGETFISYTILDEISKDETGNIYLATQAALERSAILWVLPKEAVSYQAEQAQQNFFQRISTVASLFHRNIMMLMDFAITERYFYCAFEEIDFSSNIKNYVKDHPQIAMEEVLDMAIQVAGGMSYAHKRKILHLHLTSQNILIQTGQYLRMILTEFGVSRFLSDVTVSSYNTSTGILGVSEYIAPEQISDKYPESVATDIYSYGCMLYHLVAGAPPFPTKDSYELVKLHAHSQPRPIDEVREGLPPELARLIDQCLEKEPSKRSRSFDEILKKLEQIKAEQGFNRIIHSDAGQQLLKKYIGERSLWYWWLILPLLAIIFGLLLFFAIPVL